MIHNLADISTQGNPVEGFFVLIGIVVVVAGLSSKKVRTNVRATARRVGNKEIGRKPKSKLGQALIGSRNRGSDD